MRKLSTKKIGLIITSALPLLLFLGLMHPFDQNADYHAFSDGKTIFGIFNFHNVFSNILFLLIPIYAIIQNKKSIHSNSWSISWLFFLLGVALVAPGSAYYHYNPDNMTLVWDRIPMVIAFMGLTSFAYAETFKVKNETPLLLGFTLTGLYSIWHWVHFQDLRVYYWVQLTPLISLIYIAIFLPNKTFKPKFLMTAALFYILAKICERYDETIYDSINYSGHSIKHFLAAFSVLSLVIMRSKSNCHNFRQQSQIV